MTQTFKKKIHLDIKTEDFLSINKRLLLQPFTIKANPNETGGDVYVQTEDDIESVVNHLADVVQERLVNQAINDAFSERGAYPEWANARLIPRLCLSEMNFPWLALLRTDLTKYVHQAINTASPLKLDAYLHFGSLPIKQQIQRYANELEELTFYGVIEKTLSVIGDDVPNHTVPDSENIELVGTPLSMSFRAEQNEIIHTEDIASGVANLYAEEVYLPDSERCKEAQFYTYTLLMMSRWSAPKWVVPTEIYQRLDIYRERLDIPVIIESALPQ